ncbi:MAG: helix-hairpin-helix domain-containing protein [Coriobacteriia bacterium]|nr:helix-hairpin-helix domain-containing protein [Coriobacteriia bacterium]
MSFLESERARELAARAGLADASPGTLRAIVVVVVIVIGVALWRFWPTAPAPEMRFEEAEAEEAAAGTDERGEAGAGGDASPGLEDAGEAAQVVVHVAGAVNSPGVYSLPSGSRVTDAVSAAGGPATDAAVHVLNLARLLADGEQVYVPTQEEAAAGVTGPPSAGGSVAGGGSAGGLININTATAVELEELPGVGPATAATIVDDRETNGPFTTPEDLMRVPGIGPKTFEAMKDLVTVG